MGNIFTRAEALAAGFSPEQIQREVTSGRWRWVRRGVYAFADEVGLVEPPTELLRRTRAALVRIREQVWVSHQTAAALLGLPLVDAPPEIARTGQPPRSGRQPTQWRSYPDLKVFSATVPEHHTCEQVGLPMLTTARTVVDLGRQWPLELSLVVADAAARRGLLHTGDAERVVADCRQWPGVRRAAALVPLINGLRETPLESISAAAFHRYGIEPPVSQQELFDDTGMFLGRVDFFWPRWQLIGEADGAVKYRESAEIADSTPEDRWLAERERQRRLELSGHRVVRWTWREIRQNPGTVVRRVRESMVLSVRDGLATPPEAAVRALRRALFRAA